MTLPVFPDVHVLLEEALASFVTDSDDIGTVTPADLQARLTAGRWFIRLRRIGGDDNVITDRARVDVEVYAATYAQAWLTSREIQQKLISTPVQTASGVLDRSVTESSPREVDHPNQDIRLVMATYRSSVRR